MADTKRRARGEDSIFFAPSRGCWVGEITVGWKPDGRRDRITVRGKTKTEVRDKLRAKHQELNANVRTPANYTVQQCIEDWLDSLTTQSPRTLTNYWTAAGYVIELTGSIKLADLKARDVQLALTKLAGKKSTRSVRMYRMVLVRAIRHAQVNDLAMRNVAELVSVPAGQPGRPSKALTLEQALPCWRQQRSTVCGLTWRSAFSAACVPRKHEPSAGPKLTWRQAPWPSTARCGSAGTPRRRSPAD